MDKVTGQCPQTTTFFGRERRAEADLNRGPSAYQPNALPLGQTGSHPPGRRSGLTIKRAAQPQAGGCRPRLVDTAGGGVQDAMLIKTRVNKPSPTSFLHSTPVASLSPAVSVYQLCTGAGKQCP